MIFGEKLKEAVKRSGKSDEEVAVAADMSLGNLYKVYKRDSIETRYLIGICNLLGVSMDSFFLDTLNAPSFSNLGQVNYANRVSRNQQQISVGMEDCPQRLEALQEKYSLLEKAIADKDTIIQLLRGSMKPNYSRQQLLKDALIHENVTMETLSKKLQLSPEMIFNIIETPTAEANDLLKKISDFLKVDLAYFWGGMKYVDGKLVNISN